MYAINNYNDYKEVIYSQDAHHRLKVWFNNVEYENIDNICEKLTIKSRIIPFGSKVFMLENFISKEAELILHDIDINDIQDQVKINIETYVDNDWVSVPMGIFNLQEKPTTDKNKTIITLRDNSIKFDFNYDAKPLIKNQYEVTSDTQYLQDKEYFSYDNNIYILLEVGTDYEVGDTISGTIYEKKGSATKLQILQDICTQAGVTCNISSFIGSTDPIGIYDNTITARSYVAYIAGQAGAIPVINRIGELIFIYINNLTTVDIPLWYVESYKNGDNFKISKVVYESGIIKYESGLDTYDTLYLDANNPYVSSETQVASILDIVDGFEINSFSTGKILGNPAIDCYDLIQIEEKSKNLVDFSTISSKSNAIESWSYENEVLTVEEKSTGGAYCRITYDILDIITNNAGKTLIFDCESYDFSEFNSTNNNCCQFYGVNNGNEIYKGLFSSRGVKSKYTIPDDVSNFTSAKLNFYTNNASGSGGNSSKFSLTKPMFYIEEQSKVEYEPYYDNIYKTFACNQLVYNGVCIQTFDSEISLENRKENVSLNNPQYQTKKWAKTEIDNVEGTVTILAEKVDTIDVTTGNVINEIRDKFDDYTPINTTVEIQNSVSQIITDSYTKTQIDTMLTDGTVTKLQSTLVTVDNNGTTWDKSDSNVKTNVDADGLEIIDKTGTSNETLLEAKYDSTLGETIVRAKRIKVERYLTIGIHSRFEDYENGTGCFWLG